MENKPPAKKPGETNSPDTLYMTIKDPQNVDSIVFHAGTPFPVFFHPFSSIL
jgi:hypothetical protein